MKCSSGKDIALGDKVDICVDRDTGLSIFRGEVTQLAQTHPAHPKEVPDSITIGTNSGAREFYEDEIAYIKKLAPKDLEDSEPVNRAWFDHYVRPKHTKHFSLAYFSPENYIRLLVSGQFMAVIEVFRPKTAGEVRAVLKLMEQSIAD